MKYISNEEIKNVSISSKEIFDLVDKTIRAKKTSILPPKTSMHFHDHDFFNVMPAIIPDLNLSGVKCINRYETNTPSLNGDIFLYDFKTGLLKSVLDARHITTLRTAAVAVHSIKLLAKSDYKIISFIGLGEIGKATLKILIDLNDRPLIIRLFNYKDHALIVKKLYENTKNITFEIFDDYEEMVKDSDVVISAITYASKDFAKESVYKKGVLLVPIHTLGFQECDLTFDKIFGDDYGHIQHFKYFNKFKTFNEVSEVLNGTCKGRENDNERIIAYNIGIALHDISLANLVLEKFNKK